MTDPAQLERVARAMEKHSAPFVSWHEDVWRGLARAAISVMQEPPPPPEPSEEAMRRVAEWYSACAGETTLLIHREDRMNLGRLLDRVAEDERKACAGIADERMFDLSAGPDRVTEGFVEGTVVGRCWMRNRILARAGCPKGEA